MNMNDTERLPVPNISDKQHSKESNNNNNKKNQIKGNISTVGL